jgi:sigma-E factor negative regulatory protein RseB
MPATLHHCLLAAMAIAGMALPAAVLADCEGVNRDALRWLDRMSHSLRETSYRGVFTYQHGTAVQAMRISHSITGNLEREEVTRLTGSEAKVVRTEHPLDCIHPGHRLVRIGEIYRASGDRCGIAQYYRLQVAGQSRIAGRDSVVINVLPRDIYRYGYQMAIDRETGLLLKTQTVAQDGRVLERFQFADIEIGEADEGGTRVELIHEAGHAHGAKRGPAPAGSHPWSIGWLPEGFVLTDAVAGTGHNKTFTDGLANFSVFVEPRPGMLENGAGLARQGGTTAYTRGMVIAGRPTLVTVLGEVPVNTARRVAESVAWVEAAQSRPGDSGVVE